jgi:Di-haem oxidoreductase, putative peroxidase
VKHAISVFCATWCAVWISPAYAALGDPLPGLNAKQLDQFNEGLQEFTKLDCMEDGLGPVFTGPVPAVDCPTGDGPAMACSTCHDRNAAGGGSTLGIVETRYGRVDDQGVFDPLVEWGGSLQKHNGLGDMHGIPECDGYQFSGELVPDQATVTVQRRSLPLFGLTYLNHVSDLELRIIADLERIFTPETAGRVALVTDPLTGQIVVGKFGWKAQVPSLEIFAGDAYVNEMGITNFIFPNENCSSLQHCRLDCNPDPNQPNDMPDPQTGITDTEKFQDFMRFLDIYPQALQYPDREGLALFIRTGCADCHLPALVTGPNREIAALNHRPFYAFTDGLLHDMGPSGDGIAQGGAARFEMRTAPLMGLSTQKVNGEFSLFHDGQSKSIEAAIQRHDGQGRRSATNFLGLPPAAQAALIQFLNSI